MIVGTGVDLVDIERFERTLSRTPRLLERLFAPRERLLKPHSLAARYAAKEALIKALGGSDGVHWTEIEITPEASGRPWFTLSGTTAEVVAERGITTLHLSMSHDAGIAIAYVVAEAGAAAGAGAEKPRAGSHTTARVVSQRVDGFSADAATDAAVGGAGEPGAGDPE